MTVTLRSFVQHNKLLVATFLAAILIALWFASRLVLDALYFNDPRNADVDLRPWMTPRYIVLTYDLPRPFVLDLLELDPELDRGVRLGRLVEQRGLTMDELTAQVRAAATAFREDQP